MNENQRSNLEKAAQFYKGRSSADLFPTSITMNGQTHKVLVCVKNPNNKGYFGLSEKEFDYIFNSSSINISERIDKFLGVKSNVGL
jgi:hypothetical protein